MKRTPLKRKSPLRAKKPLGRGTRPLPRTKPLRSRKRPPPAPFLAWVRSTQRCAACGASGPDPDHIKTRGAGGGDENNVWPLCRPCHTLRHAEGIQSFQRARGLDAIAIARRLWATWIHLTM